MLSLSQLRQAGRQARAQGLLDRAVEYFSEIDERDADSEPAHFELADCLVVQGDYARALVHFQRAAALNAERARSCNQIALIYSQQAQWDLAIQWLIKAIEREPDDCSAYAFLAGIYRSLNQLPLAIKWYTHCLERNRDHLGSLFELAGICRHYGFISEAAALLTEIISRHPRYLPAWGELASLSEESGSPESALACWTQALEIDPEDPMVLYQMLRLARQLSQYVLVAQLENRLRTS